MLEQKCDMYDSCIALSFLGNLVTVSLLPVLFTLANAFENEVRYIQNPSKYFVLYCTCSCQLLGAGRPVIMGSKCILTRKFVKRDLTSLNGSLRVSNGGLVVITARCFRSVRTEAEIRACRMGL